MSANDIERSIKIVPFTNKSVWSVWHKQFLARAHLKGFKSVLDGSIKVPKKKDKIDTNTAEGKRMQSARAANENAYNELLLSFSDVVNFNLVDKAVSGDLPDGDAFQAWKILKDRHEPNTAANKVGLKLEFSQSKLSDVKKDPEEWVSELEIIKIKLANMKVQISEEDLIIHIINNLPVEYDSVTDQIENELNFDDANEHPSVESVKARLRAKYSKLMRKVNISEKKSGNGFGIGREKKSEESESALYAGKHFKGTCNICGKQGHKAVNCRNKSTNNSNGGTTSRNQSNSQSGENSGNNRNGGTSRANIQCNYCNKNGHIERFCFKKRDDEARAREEARLSEEVEDEVVLTMEEAYRVSESVNTEFTWIGDSGASSNMTNSLNGVYNQTDIDVNIRIGDGRCIKATNL